MSKDEQQLAEVHEPVDLRDDGDTAIAEDSQPVISESEGESTEQTSPEDKKELKLGAHIATSAIVFIFAALGIGQAYIMWYVPSQAFPTRSLVTVPEGTTLDEASELLERQHVVKSSFLFRTIVMLIDGESGVQAGDYYFDRPLNALEAAKRFTQGEFGLLPVRVTIPEGSTTYEIADILEDKLLRFDRVTFMNSTKDKEGYLFPDTYLFLPNATIEEVVETMEINFFKRITEIEDKIDAFGRPLHEIVTLASLLEKEARTTHSRQMIAGILWNRLEIDMPLQVDAVFGYIAGRGTFHPMYSDLEVESPYNTYKNKGLPPGPIANPGLNSIEAAVSPIPNDYIFYLTGRDGEMRYSETYSQHLRYKQLYLN